MKKLLVSIFIGFVLLFSIAPLSKARAEATWYNQSFQEWYGKVYDPSNPSEIFGERYTAAQVQWIVYGLWSFVINTTGQDNAQIIQCFMTNVADIDSCKEDISNLLTDSGTVTPLANIPPPQNKSLWSLVFATDRPLSGIGYAKQTVEKFSLVPTVHAQSVGIGFNALQPVQSLWRAFRNLAFSLFILVAVIFAFMIMFRVKISPQTVIAVQSALPKMVIALVLVTFSYAIAGLLIDIMYVVIGLVSVVGSQLITGGLTSDMSPVQWFNLLTLGQPFGGNVQIGIMGLLALYIAEFFLALLVLLFINMGVLLGGVAAVVSIAAIAASGGSVLLIIALIFVIVALIMSLWIGFKTIWGLLKAFVNILLLTILAPIHIALGTVIPSLGFGNWVKSFASNLGVFVVTGALLMFSFVFLTQGVTIGFDSWGVGEGASRLTAILLGPNNAITQYNSTTTNSAWPPLLGMSGGAGVGLLFVIASFVIFTLIPKANEIIQGLISGRPYAYGSAIGEAFGPEFARKGAMGVGSNIAGGYTTGELANALAASRFANSRFGQAILEGLRGSEEKFKGRPSSGGTSRTISPNDLR